MTKLILFSTSACHLCEEAQVVIAQVIQGKNVTLTEVDIVTDNALLALYAERIPVLKKLHGSELDWPFDSAALRGFLSL